MNEPISNTKPTLLLDKPLLGLDEFLGDLGWSTIKVRQWITDDKVLKLAKIHRYVVVTPDRNWLGDVGFPEREGRRDWPGGAC